MRRVLALILVLSALVACGGDDGDDGAGAATSTSELATSTSTVSGGGNSGDAEYAPVSDVTAHAAIGKDIAAIKAAMEPATNGQSVDWTVVGDAFEKGGASKKGDGSTRTLAGLVAGSESVAFIRDAIAAADTSAGASDAVRRQRVEKGTSVLLGEKVVEELGTARTKIEAKNLDKATGAAHNVDEAWAFFTAEGNGLATTAEKRAADFKRERQVKEPVLAALVAAQSASQEGTMGAFDSAVGDVEEALRYIFYLATFKYLASEDEVGRAEGTTFYRGIAKVVEQKDPAAHRAILDAFEAGDAEAGRTALNAGAILSALGVSDSEKVTA